MNDARLEALLGPEGHGALFFTSPACGVCDVLWPKVAAVLREVYPRLAPTKVDAAREPALAAQCGVFSFPALVVYLGGREVLRYAGNLSPRRLLEDLERPYRGQFADPTP